MPSIRVTLNGKQLAHAGGSAYSSLDWELTASRLEPLGALLRLSGLRERADGNYDCDYWLEDFHVQNGDELLVEWNAGEGSTQPARCESHEAAEEFRLGVAEAMDAAKASDPSPNSVPLLRSLALVVVQVAGLPPADLRAEQEVELGCCHGFWARDRKPEQWYLRLTKYPAGKNPGGEWHSIERSIRVTVPA